MGTELFSDLAWLPPAPTDFRARCRAVATYPEGAGTELRRLATYALDEIALRKLADALEGLRRTGASLAPLIPFRLGIVGNATCIRSAGTRRDGGPSRHRPRVHDR